MENEKGEIVDLYVNTHSFAVLRLKWFYGGPGAENDFAIWDNAQEDKRQAGASFSLHHGSVAEYYVPRKCSATNRIIKANDHASVQISIGKVDENGRYTGENQSYALCGFIRARGESDDSLNRLCQRDGYIRNVWSASRQR
ncbi:hypothetical protein CNMCM8812_008708 [Aspergillus fumigatus]|nr:hypothetical protein CNMCM8714_000921 [Aspergillus fumigatus]KAF4266611.1 hypothetical protein CNMCM8057_000179 [Aspergillus fumigatus]KAF4272478.1 hypothetical protein CNMCM8812_008708 [Aspergillus fumigatus]KAF4281296.1 hypothetical protein CNMCM8689_000849 [Aspergillus fumigatus]KAF4289862.1 hypothetical protein CNMCM8686_001927 [Aspergillus fumigatus]